MTDLGKLSWFLEIQFECKNNTIKMNQSRYIEDIIKVWYGRLQTTLNSMWNGYNENKWQSQFNRKQILSWNYWQFNIMVATWPDICYTVIRLSQDLAKLNSFHLTKAKHVLHYSKGTINQSLIFKKLQKPLKLEGFCDSVWGNLDDRKRVSRFCFRLAENNPMISWKSKNQNSVTLSTCKAEFIAI